MRQPLSLGMMLSRVDRRAALVGRKGAPVDLPIRDVLRPASLDEAVAMLADHPTAMAIAGGTDLAVQLRDGRRHADIVVDLGRLELGFVRERGELLEIGAGATMDVIAGSPAVRAAAPALAAAAAQVGAWPIQCRATLGGNLGNASPAADTAPPLLVAEASVELVGPAGVRWLPLVDFFSGPGRTFRQPGELIRTVRVPRLPAGGRERFVKLGPRREQVIAVVNLAARVLAGEGGRLERVRIAVGSAAPTPVRARHAEAALEGRAPSSEVRREALVALLEDLSPIDDHRAPASYRRLAAAVLLDRFLEEVCGG